MIPTATIKPLLTLFVRWAVANEDVLAVALVGSYARGAARPDSDVDLVVITSDPERFRQQAQWVAEVQWEHLGLRVSSWADEEYGALWSRRLVLSSGLEIEVGFTAPSWARIEPLDAGTEQVARDGMWILLDPSGLLNHLVRAVNNS